MTSQEELVKEYKTIENEDISKRSKSIEEGENLDKIIQKRMKEGEIGVSHGVDNYVAVIMVGVAMIFTFFALYFIFGVSPDR